MAFCSKCGTEVNSGVKFCPNCGNVMEVNNYGGAPGGYPPVKPQMNLAIDVKSPKVILSLVSAFCALFTLIGGFIFAFDFADLEGIGVLYVFAMLCFITPAVLNTLYFLDLGGLSKNNLILTLSYASIAAYGLFYLITVIAMEAFTFYTILFFFGLLASAGLAVYCHMANYANPTLFIIALFIGVIFEAGILTEMKTLIAFEEYFLVFTVLLSFIGRMATYLTYFLFGIEKVKESSY